MIAKNSAALALSPWTTGVCFKREQWGWWDLGSDLEARLRSALEARFDELFAAGAEDFVQRYVPPGREILITWQPVAQAGVG